MNIVQVIINNIYNLYELDKSDFNSYKNDMYKEWYD